LNSNSVSVLEIIPLCRSSKLGTSLKALLPSLIILISAKRTLVDHSSSLCFYSILPNCFRGIFFPLSFKFVILSSKRLPNWLRKSKDSGVFSPLEELSSLLKLLPLGINIESLIELLPLEALDFDNF
jgi:hypothetical protein